MVVLAIACGDSSPGGAPDASDDATALDGGGDAAVVTAPSPPALPMLGPCPTGWREIASAGDGPSVCEPWPEGGAVDCGPGEAHFAGTPGCASVGGPCPAGDFTGDLPAGAAILYVLASAARGGDGSREAPFQTIAEALAVAPSGAIVAIGRGTYDEALRLTAPVTLAGACTGATTLRSTTTSSTAGVLTIETSGATVQNVRIADSARPGIWLVGAGRRLDAHGVAIESVEWIGVAVEGGARFVADGLLVRDTVPRSDGVGRGIGVESGATAEVRRAVLERNVEFGVFALGAGSSILLEDLVARGHLPSSDGESGEAIMAFRDGAIEVRRAVLEDNHEAGAFAESARLVLDQVVIRDIAPQVGSSRAGRGIHSQYGATLEIRRTRVERVHEFGLAIGSGTAIVEDVVVRDTQPSAADSTFGRGIEINATAAPRLARVWVERSLEHGVIVGGDRTVVDVEDLTVLSTEPLATNGSFGRALNVQGAAVVNGARIRLERARELSLFVSEAGSRANLVDVVIRDTVGQPCSDMLACPTNEFGVGAGVYHGASLTLGRFAIERSRLCGLHLAFGASADLADGVVSQAMVGACVQVDGYDIARLSDRVAYRDNARNLDATELPVPSVSATAM